MATPQLIYLTDPSPNQNTKPAPTFPGASQVHFHQYHREWGGREVAVTGTAGVRGCEGGTESGLPSWGRIQAGACSEGPGAPVAGKHSDLVLELLAELQGDREVHQGIVEPGDHTFYLVHVAHLEAL